MENAYLIVGLGNPGADYARTRHNAGFWLLERLAAAAQVSWRLETAFQARLAEATLAGRHCWLCQPQTYMNESGVAVASLVRFYRLPLAHVLVAVDDADLPVGEVRLRASGSSGGHHGLESVEQHLGSRSYPRLRLGIGRQPEAGRQITRHVLGRFSRAEAGVFETVLDRAAQQVTCWLAEGIVRAMNQFNGVVTAPATKEN